MAKAFYQIFWIVLGKNKTKYSFKGCPHHNTVAIEYNLMNVIIPFPVMYDICA